MNNIDQIINFLKKYNNIKDINYKGLISSLNELKDLIGMNKFKESFCSEIKYYLLQKMKLVPDKIKKCPHTILKGSSGTGKTTIAKIITKVLFYLGFFNNTNNILDNIIKKSNSKKRKRINEKDELETMCLNSLKDSIFSSIKENYDLCNKLSSNKQIITELLKNIESIKNEINKLYNNSKKRKKINFEKLTKIQENIFNIIDRNKVIVNKIIDNNKENCSIIKKIKKNISKMSLLVSRMPPDNNMYLSWNINSNYGYDVNNNGDDDDDEYKYDSDQELMDLLDDMEDDSIEEGEIIPDDDIPEIKILSRSDLVQKYVGHSAIKVKNIFKEYKIIFIDEAYSLINGDNDSFGVEVINEIVSQLDNWNGILIFAGYSDKIDQLFKINEGLAPRFQWIFEIEPYNHNELFQIFHKQCLDNSIDIDDKSVKMTWFENKMEYFPAFGKDTSTLIKQCFLYISNSIWDSMLNKNKKNSKFIVTESILNKAFESFTLMSKKKDNLKNNTPLTMYA